MTAFRMGLFFLTLLFAQASYGRGIGGYMGECYLGSGFDTDRVCARAQGETDIKQGNNTIHVFVRAEAKYLESSGERVEVSLELFVNDRNNLFNPEAKLPIIVRLIYSDSRQSPPDHYQVTSRTFLAERIPNQRAFKVLGIKKELRNGWGAAHADILYKVEVLVPGVGAVAAVEL